MHGLLDAYVYDSNEMEGLVWQMPCAHFYPVTTVCLARSFLVQLLCYSAEINSVVLPQPCFLRLAGLFKVGTLLAKDSYLSCGVLSMNPIATPLTFSKMHGLGNDFMVLDATRVPILLAPEQIRLLADRHFGVGFDQLLLVEAAQQPGVDFNYRIFNADGSEVEQCGNGARCFALYVRDKGLTAKNPIRVATRAGVIELTINQAGLVQVNMGAPKTRPADIPFIAAGEAAGVFYELDVAGETLTLAVVNMGNPHAVLAVPCIEQAQVQRLGALLEVHPRFPAKVNVGFM